MEDGYYHFFPERGRGGGLSAQALREIADYLDHVNAPWDEVVMKHV